MEQIVTCPHCGNETTHEILYTVETSEKAYSIIDIDDMIDFDVTFYLTKCVTCKDISLFWDSEIDEIQGKLSEATICYPKHNYFGEEIPNTIVQTYNEARRIKNISPTAFAVMIRRGLEFLCQEKKAKGKNLYNQLADLGKTGIIPNTLVEMGDTLRFLGNQGAHATNYKIGKTEVQAIDDFFIAMLEYVYIGPAKLNRLKETIKLKQAN
jgi:predicted nucleic-acid-binding Zn-ribbon protein